jgi:hypothetical protein
MRTSGLHPHFVIVFSLFSGLIYSGGANLYLSSSTPWRPLIDYGWNQISYINVVNSWKMFYFNFMPFNHTKGSPPPPPPSPNCTTCLNYPNEHFGKNIFGFTSNLFFCKCKKIQNLLHMKNCEIWTFVWLVKFSHFFNRLT